MALTVVPGRTCGTCTACCKVLPIDSPALQKPTGVLCTHCDAHDGCTVYAMRPDPCRDWECLWKFFENLGDDWRPDRSHIVLRPENVSKGAITVLILERGDFLRSTTFATMIAGWLANGISISFSRPSKPGHFPVTANVTAALLPRRGNFNALSQGVVRALDILDAFDAAPDGLEARSALTDCPQPPSKPGPK